MEEGGGGGREREKVGEEIGREERKWLREGIKGGGCEEMWRKRTAAESCQAELKRRAERPQCDQHARYAECVESTYAAQTNTCAAYTNHECTCDPDFADNIPAAADCIKKVRALFLLQAMLRTLK